MTDIRGAATRRFDVSRGVLAVVGVVVLVAVVVQASRDRSGAARPSGGTTVPAGQAPDAETRCAEALSLLTTRERWPMTCHLRLASDALHGQAFPPPPGEAPFDIPHVEIYVDPAQSTDDLARAIAHEFGHMHHTREFLRVTEWLRARNLPAGTPVEVWTEDYAEVFARLFGPPSERWRAPTTPPDPGDLARLRPQFFGEA